MANVCTHTPGQFLLSAVVVMVSRSPESKSEILILNYLIDLSRYVMNFQMDNLFMEGVSDDSKHCRERERGNRITKKYYTISGEMIKKENC